MFNRILMFDKTLIIMFIVVILAIFVYINMAEAQDAIKEGLVSYWTLDKSSIEGDSVKDYWGDNDGEIEKGNPKTVEGKIGEALEFDGDDYIRFTPVEMPEDVSITAWANPESWRPPGYSEVLDTWNGADWYRLGFDDSGMLECVSDTGDDDGGRESVIFDASGLTGWHHIAGVRDYDNKILRLYVDGEEVASQPFNGETALKPANLVIGARGDGQAEFFNGIIDEVGLFNIALTGDDIKFIMQGPEAIFAVSMSGKIAIRWANIKTGSANHD